jgi:DNA-directed RNA polymerase subunit beta'
MGLKENVIIGKLIPAATGLAHYRSLEIEPVEPAQPPAEELLSEEELQADLELAGDGESASLEGFGPSFAEELEELASEIETPGGGTATAESDKPEGGGDADGDAGESGNGDKS